MTPEDREKLRVTLVGLGVVVQGVEREFAADYSPDDCGCISSSWCPNMLACRSYPENHAKGLDRWVEEHPAS